ncbi:MAG: Holliday junction branch migration protein RuvA [Bacteroidales bacterium]|nr:Holliday junction branch migration protein RuvA [Bacteroidales bacterium]MBN2820336.1 Holliday junction branch migration protein RuvA [Bacteroidales bacterium]
MYEYIKGKITELTPAFAIIETSGIGYYINITLNTFSELQGKEECKLFLHQSIREDAHVLFGFIQNSEREMFRLLISVSGVGPNTARMMLSSMPTPEVKTAIVNEDVKTLQKIKGIGGKSAQRIIIDLKDKIQISAEDQLFVPALDNTLKIETLSALEVLGFQIKHAGKTVDKLISENPGISVEDLIKQALKVL